MLAAIQAQHLSSKLGSKQRKFSAEKLDDLYATIMQQAEFTILEIEAHKAIANHNATIDNVSELYLNHLRGLSL